MIQTQAPSLRRAATGPGIRGTGGQGQSLATPPRHRPTFTNPAPVRAVHQRNPARSLSILPATPTSPAPSPPGTLNAPCVSGPQSPGIERKLIVEPTTSAPAAGLQHPSGARGESWASAAPPPGTAILDGSLEAGGGDQQETGAQSQLSQRATYGQSFPSCCFPTGGAQGGSLYLQVTALAQTTAPRSAQVVPRRGTPHTHGHQTSSCSPMHARTRTHIHTGSGGYHSLATIQHTGSHVHPQ